MLLIVAAWVAGLREAPPPRLSLLYAAGSALLTVHSVSIGDPVFTALNAAATLMAAANLARRLKKC